MADALYLAHLCRQVVLVHRRDSLRATKVYHERLQALPNIRFLWDSQVSALHGENKLSALTIENRKSGELTQLPADALFISIGRSPETRLFENQVQLDEAGYILAGEDTRTNLAGVFAAGDVRQKLLRQIVTAVSDGAVAATMAQRYLEETKL